MKFNPIRLFAATLSFVFFLPNIAVADPQISNLPVESGRLQVHAGEYREEGEPVADVLFFHGYGDRFSNHEALFKEWIKAGVRVIAFDLPSHGGTEGGPGFDLDNLSFTDLQRIAAKVEKNYIENPKRPLILAGWSLGGLLAARIAQSTNLSQLSRIPSGLLLLAPGVSVNWCVGNWVCQITNETLTHDEKLYQRPITPASPIYRLGFAAHLLESASLAWHEGLPPNIPTMVVVAGDDDRYVNSLDLLSWISTQRSEFHANIQAIQCPGARHEVDNELPEYGGFQVRASTAQFLKDAAIGSNTIILIDGPCLRF